MQTIRKIINFLNHVVVTVFFTHGVFYYLDPMKARDYDNPLKLVKYVCILVFFGLNIFRISIKGLLLFIGYCLFVFTFIYISHDVTDKSGGYLLRCYTYIFPFSVVLFTHVIAELKFKPIIAITFILAAVMSVIDFYFLQGIFAYLNFVTKEGYLRTPTIFVTANNAGFCYFLMHVFFYESYKKKANLFVLSLIFILPLWCILLAGSRTSILLVALYHFFSFLTGILHIDQIIFKRKRLRTVFFSTLLVVVAAPALLITSSGLSLENSDLFENIRVFDLKTGKIRYEQTTSYLNKVTASPLAPDYDSIDETYDNGYLQLYSDFNLFGFLLFLSFVLCALYLAGNNLRNSERIILFLYFLSTFSLMIFYLWPVTYVFWYLIFKKKTNPEEPMVNIQE